MRDDQKLKIVFMGTPEFSVSALKMLAKAGHDILCVYSQPPRPAGRGHREKKSAVHEYAENLGVEVRTPKSLKKPEEQQAFADLGADVAVVVAYGLMLPKAILEAPKHGCLNIHASLLPRWRGAAPIQRALLAGDKETGVTIMQMDEGLDTGAMLEKIHVPITETMTAQDLHDVLSARGAELMVKLIGDIAAGKGVTRTPQDDAVATYADKLDREEGKIDWSLPAADIERQLRGLSPWPGVWFTVGDQRVKLHEAKVLVGMEGPPGEVLDRFMTVACGDGALVLDSVQPQNKNAMPGAAYLNGSQVKVGDRLS